MASFQLEDYEPVEERIARFYDKHPSGRIVTDLVSAEGEPGKTRWIVKAFVFRDQSDVEPAGSGYAFEIDGAGMAQKTAALETCETSAVGRALAQAGFSGSRRVTREEMVKPLVAEFEDRVAAAQSADELKAVWLDAKAQGLEKRIQGAVNKRKAEVTA